MGSAAGAEKATATRLGLTLDEYRAKKASGQKWCVPCKGWRPVTMFGIDRSRGDGLRTRCRIHGRRTDAPSKPERAQMASLGLAWCLDCRWWLPLADVFRSRCAPHQRAADRAWYAAGGYEYYRGRAAARRRAIDPAPGWWRAEQLALGCAYCDQPAVALDHVIPVALGGIAHPANLVPACTSCNSRKRDNDPLPWIARMSDVHADRISSGGLIDGYMLSDELDSLVA